MLGSAYFFQKFEILNLQRLGIPLFSRGGLK